MVSDRISSLGFWPCGRLGASVGAAGLVSVALQKGSSGHPAGGPP